MRLFADQLLTHMISSAIEPIEVDPCEPNPCGSFSLPPRVVGDRCVCNCEPHMIGTPPTAGLNVWSTLSAHKNQRASPRDARTPVLVFVGSTLTAE